jgi:poly(A) polymerase
MTSSLWPALFPLYAEYMEGDQGEKVRQELVHVFTALDRLHVKEEGAEPVKIPEPLLLAALLLPWACQRFNLPETNVRGQRFHLLSRTIRDDVDRHFGEPFNVQRMAKESIATLLINLSTFHHARTQGDDPNWLKKKSYYNDCSRFYDLYLESQGVAAVKAERFIVERDKVATVEVVSAVAENHRESKARGRGGVNPAFSSKEQGVFGLRRSRG